MIDFSTAWASVADVDGWMTDGQARALYDASASAPEGGTIVEIGSFQGRSTIILASAAPDGVTVTAIDPHAGNDRGPQEIEGYADDAESDHARFNANLQRAGVADRVRHLRMFSDEALGEVAEIDVLYIDGAHRYGPALADIRQWGAKVRPGGTMLIHDSFSSIGVTGAIGRELLWSSRWRYVGRSRSLAIYRADTNVSSWKNAGRQLAQVPWFAKNVVLKVLISAKILRGREWPY